MHVSFCSTLPHSYRRSVEKLVFFNRHQSRVQRAIVQAIDLYGQPVIQSSRGEGVHVALANRSDSQCLFAMTRRQGRPILVGMALYARPNAQELVVVHVALASMLPSGSGAGYVVLRSLIRQLRRIAERVRGIDRVQLLYTGAKRARSVVRLKRSVADVIMSCNEESPYIPDALGVLSSPTLGV